MNACYISIGPNCSSAQILEKYKLHNETFPFDWILCHLDFVYDVISALYDKSIEEAFETFYSISSDIEYTIPVLNTNGEHKGKYKTVKKSQDDAFHYNKQYKVTFAHDIIQYDGESEEKIETYKRRLTRLYNRLVDDTLFLRFFYANPTTEDWHYTVDGQVINKDEENKLNKLAYYLSTKRKNFDILYTNSYTNVLPLRKEIILLPQFKYKTDWEPQLYDVKIPNFIPQ